MSLEAAIQENTNALHALVALLSKGAVPTVFTPAVEFAKPETVKADKPAKKEAAKVEPAKAEAEPLQETKVEPAKAVDYDTLKLAVLKLATKNRAAVLAILAEFGVKNAKDLKPEQYADCLDKINAALGGVQ